jgi:hypothetical protein
MPECLIVFFFLAVEVKVDELLLYVEVAAVVVFLSILLKVFALP